MTMTTMTEHPLGVAVQAAINEAAYSGDFSAMEALISEDAVLYAHCAGSMGGIHRGRDNCLNNFKNLSALVGDSLRLDVTQMMATDSFVVMLNLATARRQRELLTEEHEVVDMEQLIAVIWRFQDGKCVEFFDHFSDPESWDAFWRFDVMPERGVVPTATLGIDRVRAIFEEVTAGGSDVALRELDADDVVSHVDGASPLGGTHVGIDEVLAGYARVRGLTAGAFSVVAEDVLVSERLITIFNRVTATLDGRSIDHVLNATWRIEHGRVVEEHIHLEDVAAWDAFWASA